MIRLETKAAAPAPGVLAEGPVWDYWREQLLWVDIPAGLVYRGTFSPGLSVVDTVLLDRPVGAVVPCASGALLAAAGTGFLLVDPDGSVREFAELELPDDGVPRRCNDAKVDPRGRLLAGTKADLPGQAALYRLDADRRVELLLDRVTISNGLGWSPDGSTLYYADSPTRRVDAFDYDLDTGTISGRRTFAEFTGGVPDGLTVDADGRVWVAVWGAGEVRAFTPDRQAAGVVDVGVAQVSSCTFAGPDLDVLVITTAADGLRCPEPDAGRLFTCRPGVTGLPVTPFADAVVLS